MTVSDAIAIFKVNDHAATDYFRNKTQQQLYDVFLPIVRTATNATGVTAAYKKLADQISNFNRYVELNVEDIDHYITGRALNGLYKYISIMERKIRENPKERVTELLGKVFGYFQNGK